MRPTHLAAVRPPCPICRRAGADDHDAAAAAPLTLGSTWRTASGPGDEPVLEGLLACPNPMCEASFPIVDGIPIVRADAATYVADAHALLLRRTDLAAPLANLLDECAAAHHGQDAARQHAASYGWDGYAAPDQPDAAPAGGDAPGTAPGAVIRLLAALDTLADSHGLATAADAAAGELVLDVGCGAGRSCLELAAAGQATVLGLDANWPLLRIAAGVVAEGVARFPVRRTGLVFEEQVVPVEHPGRGRTDVWCADAHALPVPDGAASLVLALNVLDCLQDPVSGLREIRRVLRPGGVLQLATPFDWSPSATPAHAWIGGHSPLGQAGGDPASLLRALLTPGAHAQSIDGLELVAMVDDLPWSVRVHDRATMHYRTAGLVARRT